MVIRGIFKINITAKAKPNFKIKDNIKRDMKTYWKFILIFGILMMDFYLLMTFLFKENDGKKVKETENILDQLGLYEIMQLIFMYTNTIAFNYFD